MKTRYLLTLLFCLLAVPAWACPYIGDFPTSAAVDFKWNTNGQDGASITRSTDGTLKVFKDNSTTERTSLAGVTQSEDFDAATGVHHVRVDLSDNTDAGFYAAGHEYQIVMTGMTIDTKTVNSCIAQFSIERAGGVLALIKARTPNAAAGAAGGLFIAGTNAPVTITGSGAALTLTSTGGNGAGLSITGNGSGNGITVAAGATGKGISVSTTAGDGLSITPTAGNAIVATANGTSKHGIVATGGTAGTSDGIKAVAGTGGVDFRAATGITVDACTGCSTAGGVTIMPETAYLAGSTSIIEYVFIKDTSTNLGKTGLTNGSAGLTMVWRRVDQGNTNWTACPSGPQPATRGAYTSCGFVEDDPTNAAGWYQIGLPTAALAANNDKVEFGVYGVSGTSPTILPIALVTNSVKQVYDRLGAPTGASTAADIAAINTLDTAIKAKTDSLGFTGSNVNANVQATAATLSFNLNGSITGNLSGNVGGVDTINPGAIASGSFDTGAVTADALAAGAITNSTFAAGAVNNAVIADGAISAGKFAAGAIDSSAIAANAIGASEIADGAIDNGAFAAGAIGATTFANDAITAASISADVAIELAQRAAGTFRKNVVSQRRMPLYLADSTTPKNPVTGATVTVRVTKDGGVEGTATGTVAEIGSGLYMFLPSQADTNCDTCVYRASATGALDWKWTIYTTD